MSTVTLDQILNAVKESNKDIKLLNEKLDNVNTELTTQLTNFIHQVTQRCDNQDKKIVELEENFKKTKEELRICQMNLKNTNDKMNRVEERVISNEGHQRRLNLIFQNVKESVDENIIQKINHVMTNLLKIPIETVKKFIYRDVHRLGRNRNNNSESGQPRNKNRAIIIAFVLQEDRNLVFNHAKNLAGTEVSLKVDLPAEWSKEREQLLIKRRTIKDFNNDLVAIIKYKAYRPILLVKIDGEMSVYNDNMDLSSLETHTNRNNGRVYSK